jgi:hypothetical protein
MAWYLLKHRDNFTFTDTQIYVGDHMDPAKLLVGCMPMYKRSSCRDNTKEFTGICSVLQS